MVLRQATVSAAIAFAFLFSMQDETATKNTLERLRAALLREGTTFAAPAYAMVIFSNLVRANFQRLATFASVDPFAPVA